MAKFIIQDWAGNHLFTDEEFESYEEGWEYIYEHVDNSLYDETGDENDNEYQEYYVVEKKS